MTPYKPIKQIWNFHVACTDCGFVSLESESKVNKRKCLCCCDELHKRPEFPKLKPIPNLLLPLFVDDVRHMGRFSAYYNNMLSISATGVDHGPEGSGWEQITGDHAVKLHGRTYHFLPPTGGAGGISYFTFDALNAAIQHGHSLKGEHLQINDAYVTTLYNVLLNENVYVKECELIGNGVRALEVSLNTKTSIFDVAAVTSVHAAGDRVLR
jgi:hypothetical protein